MNEQKWHTIIVGAASAGKTTPMNDAKALLTTPSRLTVEDVQPLLLTPEEVDSLQANNS